MADPTPDEVLATPMEAENEAGVDSIGQFLIALSRQVWREGECFSGNSPFGSSSWEWELAAALGYAGYAQVVFDDEGAILEADFETVKRLIEAAFQRLFELLPPPRLPR